MRIIQSALSASKVKSHKAESKRSYNTNRDEQPKMHFDKDSKLNHVDVGDFCRTAELSYNSKFKERI